VNALAGGERAAQVCTAERHPNYRYAKLGRNLFLSCDPHEK
jgi:hypothetical protein